MVDQWKNLGFRDPLLKNKQKCKQNTFVVVYVQPFYHNFFIYYTFVWVYLKKKRWINEKILDLETHFLTNKQKCKQISFKMK